MRSPCVLFSDFQIFDSLRKNFKMWIVVNKLLLDVDKCRLTNLLDSWNIRFTFSKNNTQRSDPFVHSLSIVLVSVNVAILLPIVLSGEKWHQEQAEEVIWTMYPW